MNFVKGLKKAMPDENTLAIRTKALELALQHRPYRYDEWGNQEEFSTQSIVSDARDYEQYLMEGVRE